MKGITEGAVVHRWYLDDGAFLAHPTLADMALQHFHRTLLAIGMGTWGQGFLPLAQRCPMSPTSHYTVAPPARLAGVLQYMQQADQVLGTPAGDLGPLPERDGALLAALGQRIPTIVEPLNI